ncbi:hypothetical protein MMC07_004894 [Pseudocyphellaria aurata]|nr:hypothetical protein [Pseudocyphellaria aurata]
MAIVIVREASPSISSSKNSYPPPRLACLAGSGLELVIYETHETPKRENDSELSEIPKALLNCFDTVGGALGAAPGNDGVRVLRHLDENLDAPIVNQAYPVSRFCILNAPGWNIPLTCHPREQSTAAHGPDCSTSGQASWDLLRDQASDSILERRSISRVICAHDQSPRVSFAVGSPNVEAGLAVSAGGVRSRVKSAVLLAHGVTDNYNTVQE